MTQAHCETNIISFKSTYDYNQYLHSKRSILLCCSVQTREEYHHQYMAYLRAQNISKAPNITAYTYDAVWVIAAALNKSLSRIDAIKAMQGNFSFQHPNITEIFKSAIQHIHFKGITVCQ